MHLNCRTLFVVLLKSFQVNFNNAGRFLLTDGYLEASMPKQCLKTRMLGANMLPEKNLQKLLLWNLAADIVCGIEFRLDQNMRSSKSVL